MTKEELFKKYDVNESHNVWQDIDSWMNVELFRFMRDRLPGNADTNIDYVVEFLDKLKSDKVFFGKAFQHKNFGSFYLTAKRMVYRFADDLIKENETILK